jgi:LysM repeat protein
MTRNLSVKLTGILLLGVILTSACTYSYSQAPLGTPTLLPTNLFVSPFPSGQDPLQIVAALGTETAVAKTEVSGGTVTTGTPGTPVATPTGPTATSTVGTAVTQQVQTLLPVTVIPAGSTFTPTTYPGTVIVPTVSSARPGSYTLQQGEFVFCIARRFNLNPDDVLAANGLMDSQTVYPGLTLTIPQTGSFPGDRAWHTHPDTYTVSGDNDTTLYGVACYYGDVFPEAIASANNLPLSTTLTVGQHLTIP